ncbi:MAG: glycerate kinase [Actinomycetota bacterium]
MRVLIAPDKFRGTMTAERAALAIEIGWLRARPGDTVMRVPMADGGEGTLDALLAASNGRRITTRVTGPLGDPVDAPFGVLPGPDGPVAVVEMSRASGVELLGPNRRDPMRATTRGTGELIRAALAERPTRVVVGLGGSATSDGGAGMAQALGARLLDARRREIGPGGAALLDLERVDVSGLDPTARGVRFLVAADVDNPLVGPSGAAHVFAPQKGASHEDVLLLDRALSHYAAILERDLGVQVRDLPGAGAAGGLAAGLVAFLGAHLRPGVEIVMDALRVPERILSSDLVVTGEGKLDASSLGGKTVAGIARVAREAGVPTLVLVGTADATLEGAEVASLVERFGERRAFTDAERGLTELATERAEALTSAEPR